MDRLLTVPAAAAALGVHKQTAYRMVWAGLLPWVNVGLGKSRPRVRVRESAVKALIQSRERGVAA